MSCPSCSKLNFSDSKACYSCGAPLRGGPPGPTTDGFQQQSASFKRDWSDASQIERTSFVDAMHSVSRPGLLAHLPMWQRALLICILFGLLLMLNLMQRSSKVDDAGSRMADRWGITYK
jgi:hypothetical protein